MAEEVGAEDKIRCRYMIGLDWIYLRNLGDLGPSIVCRSECSRRFICINPTGGGSRFREHEKSLLGYWRDDPSLERE
jgi:hypothetical protein